MSTYGKLLPYNIVSPALQRPRECTGFATIAAGRMLVAGALDPLAVSRTGQQHVDRCIEVTQVTHGSKGKPLKSITFASRASDRSSNRTEEREGAVRGYN